MDLSPMDMSWEETWEVYRWHRENEGLAFQDVPWAVAERFLLPNGEDPATLPEAAEAIAFAREHGGRIESNGEITWNGDAATDAEPLRDSAARDLATFWPLARELLAFERQLDQDLAAEVTRGR